MSVLFEEFQTTLLDYLKNKYIKGKDNNYKKKVIIRLTPKFINDLDETLIFRYADIFAHIGKIASGLCVEGFSSDMRFELMDVLPTSQYPSLIVLFEGNE